MDLFLHRTQLTRCEADSISLLVAVNVSLFEASLVTVVGTSGLFQIESQGFLGFVNVK